MSLLDAAWSALGEDAAALALVRSHADAIPLESSLPVGPFVHDAIAAASLSAALLAGRRTGSAVPTVELDPARVVTSVTSERHFRIDGDPVNAWAELSGFWPTAKVDGAVGWVRTHANYRHHREALVTALGLPGSTSADELLAHLHRRTSAEVEDLVAAAGGVAVAARTEHEWREHPQSVAVAATPLVGLSRTGDAPPAHYPETGVDAPARGIRVLDLTRVIAGPVASRTLALWGADVLRVDSPRLPEIPWQHLDGGAGKRSALVDFASDRETLNELLDRADVVLTGYRTGALDRYGLSPEALAADHPGIVVARLSAWGSVGPWAQRRGFDSIVQAATGIGWLESADGGAPGAMPAQALDHSAGYLLAAGITTALRRRLDEGGSWLVETGLARIAAELLAQPRHPRLEVAPWHPTVVVRGNVTSTAAAPHYDGGPDDWATPAVPWGSSPAAWLD